MGEKANRSVVLASCCIRFLFNRYCIIIDCRKSSGHTPDVYMSWHIPISSFIAPSSKFLSISAGMLSIPSALLFLIPLWLLLPPLQGLLTQCLPFSPISPPPPCRPLFVHCPHFCR